LHIVPEKGRTAVRPYVYPEKVSMSVTINDVISWVDDWKGKQVSSRPMEGLTNPNWLVEVDGVPYFVRIPGEGSELLAIDRNNELHNTKAASESGAGPTVLYAFPEHGVMVLKFIDGKTMSNETLNEPGMPKRIATSLKMLHAGPRFLQDFNMFRLTEFYLGVASDHQVTIPDRFHPRMAAVHQIEEAMNANPIATVPCHNDLLAANYIDDGNILRLVDFEYSGNNDPTFELGNTAQELEYDEARRVELCEAYFGKSAPDKLARMKLNMIMSDVGWTLWAAIQAKISKIEFDFWGWAVERWARAEAKMDSAEFADWLKEVQTS
jgi:thiamine kinase-like enzyme